MPASDDPPPSRAPTSLAPAISTSIPPRSLLEPTGALGNIYGTGIRGAVEYFLGKYGPSGGHAVIARLSPSARSFVTPNAPVLGILGAKKYPYPFVGELLRTMAAVVRVDEDAFLRECGRAGVDATVNTVARVALRYVLSPAEVAKRAQELWNVFHDAGRITITDLTDREYLSHLKEWPNHDLTVCKLGVEAAVRLVEKTGVTNVEGRREKCIAWGHDYCLTRMRWTPRE